MLVGPDNLFDQREVCVTSSLHRPVDGHALIIGRALPAQAVRFALDWLFSMDNARRRIFGPGGTPGYASGVVGAASSQNWLAPYPDDGADDKEFSDVLLILPSPFV